MANIQAPACKRCCCQFLVRYSDETDPGKVERLLKMHNCEPGDGGGEGQREEDEYDADGEKNSSKNTYFQLLKVQLVECMCCVEYVHLLTPSKLIIGCYKKKEYLT